MVTSNGDRLNQHKRPPLPSHQSCSVPSTPYSHPRDVRFHSRSRSPHARSGSSQQSPKSADSEATSHSGVTRSTSGVCKFESGAEIRKRRIPYLDGGNEELAPPEKEPKKALEPDEEKELDGSLRKLYETLLPSAESESRKALLVEKLDRILNEEWPGSDIRVNVFGSSGNMLSSSDSDVDICITTPLSTLNMHQLATILHKRGMEKVVCRASAKVPIAKCWDPELELAADLNVNNTLALDNTRMIKAYVQLDDRVRPLAKIIKYWTKRRILNDASFGGTISSYTWICMVISFLQRRDPPILPALQKIKGGRSSHGHEDSPFADNVESLKDFGNANKESLGALVFHFFRHYGYEFDYSRYVVSIREGRLLERKEKGWDTSNYADKEAWTRLCVEEPFTVNRNLGNSADEYAWSGIHGEIRRAFDLLADGGQLNKCCEQFVFPIEEKPVIQRPPPRPKPTLTRSASQSGRTNHPQNQPHSQRVNSRNHSTQRSGTRRASSGPMLNIPGYPTPMFGQQVIDYFASTGTLHDHLAQQYQFLQAQQDALQARLLAQQHQQQAAGLHNPMLHFDPSRIAAPLLPGYLYTFPPRYSAPAPLPYVRSRDGSYGADSLPSPAASAAQSSGRRSHRASAPEVLPGPMRSQSQPGRTLPMPIPVQSQVHPGPDRPNSGSSGRLGQRSSSVFSAGHTLSNLMLPHSLQQTQESAIPKEYIGYYLGADSRTPYSNARSQRNSPPASSLDGLPHRPRRTTPDLMPPQLSGFQLSRSSSPFGHSRQLSTVHDENFDEYSSQASAVDSCEPTVETKVPLVLNGSSTHATKLEPTEGLNGTLPLQTSSATVYEPSGVSPTSGIPSDDNTTNLLAHNLQSKQPARLQLPVNGSGSDGLGQVPQLSPVQEMRTPSPSASVRDTFGNSFKDASNGLVKAASFANASNADPNRAGVKRHPYVHNGHSLDERLDLVHDVPPQSTRIDKNPWQQAPRKGKKKSELSTAANELPINENERKGG